VKRALNIFLVVLITTLSIFCTNLISTAYAQETKLTPIMGQSQATKQQAIQSLKKNNSSKTDEYINEFVNTTWEEATIEDVRPDVAFSLMMLETGWLKFGGRVPESYNNFGGIGATDDGGTPAQFPDMRTGIRAVVQHLKAYASPEKNLNNNECVDPRFDLVTGGSAQYVEWLGIRENPEGRGWASEQGYGYKIINIINEMCGNPLTPFIYELKANLSGSTYNITTQSLNANGVLYKFVAINSATGQQTVIQNYSQKSTATWTPSNSGSYIIKAYIKRPSSPYEYDAYTTCNVTPTTVIKSFNIEGTSFFTGGSYKLSASATSANKPLYKFFVRDSNFNWTVLQDYSETNSVTWKPTKPDQYLLVVHVKDSNSSNTYDTYTSRSVTVKDTTIESFTVGNGSGFHPGKSYTVSAKAYSANKPLYKFWVRDDSDFSWTVIKDYSEVNTATWTPTKSGTYLLVVHVKDSNSSNSYDTFASRSVTVRPEITIVLDAGHGGSDPGAVSQSTGLKESDLNLEQTLILGNLLKAYGFNVIYTRDTNKYLSLEERVDIANNINADLFISIHHDSAYPNTSVKGISTHYSTYRPLLDNEGLYEEYSSTWGGYITLDSTPCDAAVKSKILAERIASGLASLGFNNRGTHDHNLYVTKWTTMPSVLIEVGFMSNDEEVKRVANQDVQKAIAQKIVDIIIEFFNEG